MNDSTVTIRQALQAKIDAARADIAEAEKQLAQLPQDFLEKVVGEFHKLIGWL
ncbi:MAG TPA: hypothetical protein VJQ82_09945 [Terriglobales bacterium]|nr:hypothetical protein [Terriglobales bacterium]